MAQGWSFAGQRVEFRAALPAGKLVVLAPPSKDFLHELKLSQTGEWTVPVAGQSIKVVRKRVAMTPVLELFSPPAPRHVAPGPAPAGSVCPTHQAAALGACARCGTFMCPSCAGADLTHCSTCFGTLHEAAQKNAAAMAYFAPVIVFAIMGGLLGGLFGGAAGVAAMAIAKRTDNKAVKIGAAVGLYTVAAILWIVIAVLLRG
jgi:hypothetical protein